MALSYLWLPRVHLWCCCVIRGESTSSTSEIFDMVLSLGCNWALEMNSALFATHRSPVLRLGCDLLHNFILMRGVESGVVKPRVPFRWNL